VAAASKAARRLGFAFTLSARAENHIRGNPDLGDTVARLQAYERAGADVALARAAEEMRDEGDFSTVAAPVRVGEWLTRS